MRFRWLGAGVVDGPKQNIRVLWMAEFAGRKQYETFRVVNLLLMTRQIFFWHFLQVNFSTLNSTWKMKLFLNESTCVKRKRNEHIFGFLSESSLWSKVMTFLFHYWASHSSAVRFLLLRKRRLDIRVLGSVPFHSWWGANKKHVANSYETLACMTRVVWNWQLWMDVLRKVYKWKRSKEMNRVELNLGMMYNHRGFPVLPVMHTQAHITGYGGIENSSSSLLPSCTRKKLKQFSEKTDSIVGASLPSYAKLHLAVNMLLLLYLMNLMNLVGFWTLVRLCALDSTMLCQIRLRGLPYEASEQDWVSEYFLKTVSLALALSIRAYIRTVNVISGDFILISPWELNTGVQLAQKVLNI